MTVDFKPFCKLPSVIQYKILSMGGVNILPYELSEKFLGLKLAFYNIEVKKTYKYFTANDSTFPVKKAWMQAICSIKTEPTIEKTCYLALDILMRSIPLKRSKEIIELWGKYSLNIGKIQAIERIYDRSLELMWERICSYNFNSIPPEELPTNSKDIKLWLNNPENGKHLKEVNKLLLDKLNLEVIPPEIKVFKSVLGIDLSDNFLEDASILGDMQVRVFTIKLNNNRIKSLNFMKNHKNIFNLHVENNLIEDISPLRNIKLICLYISNNPVRLQNLRKLARIFMRRKDNLFNFISTNGLFVHNPYKY